jgi:hypothetical protein
MFFRNKKACVDCHFFLQEARALPNRIALDVEASNREAARNGDYTWVAEYSTLACTFGVWDEGHNFRRADRHRVIVETDRRNFCFWWKYRPGMLIPAAKILQEREAKDRDSSRDRRLTLWGLWIAAIALLANVWLTIADKLKMWPFK